MKNSPQCFDALTLQLVIVWTTGIGVLVRCFSQKTSFEKEIIHRLGSSFSRVPYIIVVVCIQCDHAVLLIVSSPFLVICVIILLT
jgi:hypothetical protein